MLNRLKLERCVPTVLFCNNEAEYSVAFPQRGGPKHIIDFGTAYTPSPHQQLDFHLEHRPFGRNAGSLDRLWLLCPLPGDSTQVIDRDMAVFSFSFYAWV